jgi:hypothetical protein
MLALGGSCYQVWYVVLLTALEEIEEGILGYLTYDEDSSINADRREFAFLIGLESKPGMEKVDEFRIRRQTGERLNRSSEL